VRLHSDAVRLSRDVGQQLERARNRQGLLRCRFIFPIKLVRNRRSVSLTIFEERRRIWRLGDAITAGGAGVGHPGIPSNGRRKQEGSMSCPSSLRGSDWMAIRSAGARPKRSRERTRLGRRSGRRQGRAVHWSASDPRRLRSVHPRSNAILHVCWFLATTCLRMTGQPYNSGPVAWLRLTSRAAGGRSREVPGDAGDVWDRGAAGAVIPRMPILNSESRACARRLPSSPWGGGVFLRAK
jgi:hypothetical protein